MYIATHKRKDGSYVNDAAKTIGKQIEVSLTQSTADESEVSPNDVVGRVFGPEHSGRVRCMGMGAAPTNTFRNTRLQISDLSLFSSNVASSSSCSNQCKEKYTILESQLQGTLNALKAYMIMKEGKVPDELASFFVSQPSDAGSEPESPLHARGSSGGSNLNSQNNI
ncbi:putative transposase, Ptta/En/Spm, plant [Sesbania bispinosa]|nr:putative transposase, Ptta/En/Spm, plant [Sesbania bispinosa]